jgi:hypothetical protein
LNLIWRIRYAIAKLAIGNGPTGWDFYVRDRVLRVRAERSSTIALRIDTTLPDDE